MIEIDESWEQSIIQEQENKDEIDTSNPNIKLEKKNNNSNIEQKFCIELQITIIFIFNMKLNGQKEK